MAVCNGVSRNSLTRSEKRFNSSVSARLIEVNVSSVTLVSFIQPFASVAFIIEYSPLTLYAAIGNSGKASFTTRITSIYASAGFTINMSAPSSTSHPSPTMPSFCGSWTMQLPTVSIRRRCGLPIPDCRQCVFSACSGYQISAHTKQKRSLTRS